MKELNNKIEDAKDYDERNCENSDTPFTRLVDEKQALDEKIIKLHAFLKDEETASKIAGSFQVGQMREQLEVMLRYSSILNTRILTWRHDNI